MTDSTRIEGLGHDWRRLPDGTAQQLVKEDVGLDFSAISMREPLRLAEKLVKFASAHSDSHVDIEHDYDSSGHYGCDTSLQLEGWADRSELLVKRAQERARAQKRTDDAARRRMLEAELAKLK